jgi:hypothetical protein
VSDDMMVEIGEGRCGQGDKFDRDVGGVYAREKWRRPTTLTRLTQVLV